MAQQRFETENTARETFVLTALPTPFCLEMTIVGKNSLIKKRCQDISFNAISTAAN